MSDDSNNNGEKKPSSAALKVQDTPLTIREHLDPDKHWIGEALAPPTQGEIEAFVGTVAGPGESPFVARADHKHKLDPTVVTAITEPLYVNIAGDSMTGGLNLPSAGISPGGFIQWGVYPLSDSPGNLTLSDGRMFLAVGPTNPGASIYMGRVGSNPADAGYGGQTYVSFHRSATASNPYHVQIGSITITGAVTGVLYNTSSHGPWKGNVKDLDDTEAIQHIKSWRPVAFQWKMNEDGEPSEHGVPTGEVEHGFIAQELNQWQPNVVTEGYGTEADHDEWMDSQVDGVLPSTPDPFRPWQVDMSKLIPDIAAGLQALIRRVEKLTDRVKALEGQISG